MRLDCLKAVFLNNTIITISNAKPITVETTGLYGITYPALKKNKCRIGKKPFFLNVSKKEALDLDTDDDFKILEKVYKL